MYYKKGILFLLALGILSCNNTADKISKAEMTKEFKIDYEKFTLDNGLEFILHVDKSDPIVAMQTVMHVGSNREKPGKTGFAHFFEHMAFNDSENVPVGANRKTIPEWGGTRNGGTSNDYTYYNETVPKDAFEKLLWINSDRFGYMINTVTKSALEREKQVVKNEKRQGVDNAAYGYTNEIIRKNLYPFGHPYSWTIIGALPDLQAATIDDVKEFHAKYYGSANATIAIAGDIDIEDTKRLIKQWFGEIPSGPVVDKPKVQTVVLERTKSLYFEDDFAKLPELRLTFPTVEAYHKDTYALSVLAEILGGSKSAPLYKTIVKELELAPRVNAYNNSTEITGEFVFTVRANANIDLDKVKNALDESLLNFEKEGVNKKDLKRIKAKLETRLYTGLSSVRSKALSLAENNEAIGDPGFSTKSAGLTNTVTAQDIMRVYETYLKGKHFVMTSVVPKNEKELAVKDAILATVWKEEIKQNVANEEVSQGEEANYTKTPSKYSRSEPAYGELPLFKSPEFWKGSLKNGLKIYGIENSEVPLVQFNIVIPGGQLQEDLSKAGTCRLLSQMMMQGTVTKTSAELEEAIGLLGASITVSSSKEALNISGSCLSENFSETIKLVQEIILEPRWDIEEFNRLKTVLNTNLKGKEANANYIGYYNFNKLIYGDKHPFGVAISGNYKTTKAITIQDLKDFYALNISPKGANFHSAGNLSKAEIIKQLNVLNDWNGKEVIKKNHTIPLQKKGNTLYFVDIPNSKQSLLRIGKLAVSKMDKDANKLSYSNEILGGGSSGRLTQVLRIDKGYTYGAFAYTRNNKTVSTFQVATSVRANATLKSLEIIQDILQDYGPGFTEADVDLTQNKILKAKTRAFESLGGKLGIVTNLTKYDLSDTYLEDNQNELIATTLEDYKRVIETYINEKDMIYVVVGDKKTQFEEVKKLGMKIVELDIYGNVK